MNCARDWNWRREIMKREIRSKSDQNHNNEGSYNGIREGTERERERFEMGGISACAIA